MSEQKTPADLSKFTDFEVSMLIIERNVAQYRAESIDELLNKVGQAKGLSEAEKKELDFEKLLWEDQKSDKGPYQQTSEKANQNSDLWKALKAKLKEHQGFWQSAGFKFWFDMQQESVVDRRKIG